MQTKKIDEATKVYWSELPAPIRPFRIYWGGGRICRLELGNSPPETRADWWKKWFGPVEIRRKDLPQEWALKLGSYFRNGIPLPALPMDLRGTPFQLAVWRRLKEIRHGRLTTYGELARRVGRPKAFRAVGAAMGANPIPLLIPCHRVLPANGALGGFGGGARLKRWLLWREESLPHGLFEQMELFPDLG